MILNKIIVHEVKKDPGVAKTVLFTSNSLVASDKNSLSLVDSLLKSYQGDKILYADFDRSPSNYFPSRLSEYRLTERTVQDFITFTIDCTLDLEKFIKPKTLAKGGYLVFTEYENNGGLFIAIFLIRDTEGKLLKRRTDSFTIKTIDYLDTNHLAMACKINENKLDLRESNYISLTRLKQQDVSDYFMDWICVSQSESSAEFTNALYTIINGIPAPIHPETKIPYSIDEVRNMVYENAKNNAQKNINIQSLSMQIYGDPDTISSYADSHQISIDTEFRYNKKALNRFIQLNIKSDGINLKLSRGDVGTKVRLSEERQNVVLIESERFAKALRIELNGTE